jgi:putative hemolysin
MSEVAVEGLAILVLIIVNGFLAMSEIAVVSSRVARLKHMATSGSRRAGEALALARDPDRLLAAVQVGITLVAVLSGAYAGATIAQRMEGSFSDVAWLKGHAQDLSMTIVVAVVTYLTLVLGELAPKRLALSAPERIALLVARPMRWLSMLTAPAVWLLTRSTAAVLLPLRMPTREEDPVTADEIEVLIDEGTDVGVFTPNQRELIEGVLRLREYQARDLMVPRTVLDRVRPGDQVRGLLEMAAASAQSYYPVVAEDEDTVLGIVRGWDVLLAAAKGQQVAVETLAETPAFVPESASIPDVLAALQRDAAGAAIVIEEQGGLSGMISRDEILRAIGGRAVSVVSDVETMDWEFRDDGSSLVDGLLPLVELREGLGLRDPLPEEGRYGTVGGFVMSRLQKIPEIGDAFEAHGFRFEVLELDQRRVSRVRVAPTGPAADDDVE